MNWNKVKLGDVCEINPRYSGELSGADEISFVPMAAVSEVSADVVNEQFQSFSEVKSGLTPFKADDILFAKITPCFENGKIARANISREWGFGSTEFHVFRPHECLDKNYLLHFLRMDELRKEGKRNMTGSAGQKRVPKGFLSKIEIPLPPLAEQQRLAAILDQSDALRALRRDGVAALDELGQSLFLELFGDPAMNPKNWEMVKFAAIGSSRLGKMLDARKQTGKHLRPYLRNANVQWHRFDLSSIHEMDFNEKDRETFRLCLGDLLICEGGEPGRAAIWRGEIEEIYYQKALHRVRVDTNKANPDYLVHLLDFLAKGGHLSDQVTAATIAHLTGEKLATVPIPLPPLALQQEFARQIGQLETLKARARAQAVELDALFAALSARAFAGELS